MKKFLTIIEKTKTGYSAYVPDLPGCVATGKTKASVAKNIYSAIQFHLDGLKSEGEKIPDTRTEGEMLVFSV
jgi:predicted RNase H-like HicB family nuclease